MASNDLRDVLSLPTADPSSRPSKKSKAAAAPRPNLKGLAREVQSLGGDTPIAIVPEVAVYKKRRLVNRKPAAKWELRSFRNSARDDASLILRHWRRRTEEEGGATEGTQQPQQIGETNSDAPETATENGNGVNGTAAAEDGEQQNGGSDNNANSANGTTKSEPELEDSSFAKFNVKVQVPEYNDEQYEAHFLSEDWSKDETDYLFELVRDFHLRWPLIWDRFDYAPKNDQPEDMEVDGSSTAVVPAPKKRTMEDLKKRYYDVAAKMMEIQKPKQYMTQFEWDIHTMMLNFDPEKEAQRKRFALNTMARTEAEAKEEESLLIEVKRIMARAERFNEERRELYQRLEYPPSDQDISAFKGSAGLTQLLNQLQTQSQARKRKPIAGPDQTATPTGAAPNAQPSSAVSETASNRRESIAAQPAANHRETASADKAPTASSNNNSVTAASNNSGAANNNKKGQPPPERRKLSEYEEQIYGVSSHERLSSGPTFRYDRVNKLFSHKSGQQQHRIQTVLNELDIPARLNMPTATVVAEYEKLVLAVTSLVDLRKQKDKIENEIRIEEAKRAERVKAKKQAMGLDGDTEEAEDSKKEGDASKAKAGADAPAGAEGKGETAKSTTAATSESKPAETNGNTSEKKTHDAQPKSAQSAAAASSDKEAPSTSTDGPKSEKKEAPDGSSAATNASSNGDGDAKKAAEEGEADGKGSKANPVVKQEDGVRPGSSGGSHNKRSASVLSAASDKSAKRQKK